METIRVLMESDFPLSVCQVPAVEETTAGASRSTQSPSSSSAPAITRYSQVMNQDDLVHFLCNQLLAKFAELKDMEARLKTAESAAQVAAEREDFILSDLASTVSELDCKFIGSVVFLGCLEHYILL